MYSKGSQEDEMDDEAIDEELILEEKVSDDV